MSVIQKHQTIVDMALLHSGSFEAFFELALLNGLELTQEVSPGTDLILPPLIDPAPVKFYLEREKKPVTGVLGSEDLSGEGLEYWAIEYDFIIS